MTHVDEPALENDTTTRLFEQRVQCVRAYPWIWLCVAASIALTVPMWRDAPVLALAFTAVGLYGVWQALAQRRQPSQGWIPAARRLLEDEPWQDVPVTVLATRGTVLVLPGGEQVRVFGLTPLAREVIVRTGRAGIVGPDGAGWLAVRVDGLHTPWPARLVRAVSAAPAMPTAEPVVTAWTRYVVVYRRGDLVFAVVAAVGLTIVSAVVGDWLDVAIAVVAGVVVAAVAVHRLRAAIRLRAAGNWRRATAAVSWTHRRNGAADGTVDLVFPDGHRFVARLDGVPADLLATAWREETLWVADGGVVGFPGYPLAAVATITPVAVSSTSPH